MWMNSGEKTFPSCLVNWQLKLTHRQHIVLGLNPGKSMTESF